MGCQCRLDGGIARIVFDGPHDFEDELRALRLGLDESRLLLDIRTSERHWTAAEACELAETLENAAPETRCAVLAGGALQYGLARMFASYAEFQDVAAQVFRDRRAAEAWLLAGPVAHARFGAG